MDKDSKRLMKRRESLKKASKKFRENNSELVKKNDRDAKRKKYAEDLSFRAEVKERARLQYKLKKLKEKLDNEEKDAE